jgi:hypothetical protein
MTPLYPLDPEHVGNVTQGLPGDLDLDLELDIGHGDLPPRARAAYDPEAIEDSDLPEPTETYPVDLEDLPEPHFAGTVHVKPAGVIASVVF